jgi:hypothetical protein
MTELMQNHAQKDSQNKGNPRDSRYNTLPLAPVYKCDPTDKKQKRDVHKYINAGEPSDSERPFHYVYPPQDTAADLLFESVARAHGIIKKAIVCFLILK